MSERERQVMKKLKEVVDKQRDEIRAKDRELTLKNEDIEAVRPHSQYNIIIVWMSSFPSFFSFRSQSYHLAETVSTACTHIQVAVLKVPHYAGFQFSSEVGQK